MQHNLENCFGIFVEIYRNIISSLKSINLRKQPEKELPSVIL